MWLAQTEQRLATSGYIISEPVSGVALSDLMPPQVVLEQVAAQSHYRYHTELPDDAPQTAAIPVEDLRCNEHMPRAKARCVLPRGHSGAHRSGKRRRA